MLRAGVQWLVAVVLVLTGWPGLAGADCLVVGVVPQLAAVKLAESWGPLLALVAERTGIALCFETARDIPTFEQRLEEGRYDIAYMNPYHYLIAHARLGYAAFAREKGARLEGLVVVRKDSPFRSLEDLRGREVAFPAPRAFAASILTRAHLRSLGIAVIPRYVESHDSVYLGVARGYFAAGGGIRRTLAHSPPEIREALRVLWESPGYTPHPLAAQPRVPAAVVVRLTQGFAALADDPPGRAALARAGLAGFEAGRDADWDDVRALGLDNLGAVAHAQ